MAEAAVGVTVNRFKKNPNADIELGTLKAIATAAGVNLLWLIEGAGPRDLAEVPDSYQVVYDVRYPNLHKALTRPPIETMDPRTVRRAVSRTNASNTDLTVEQWLRWIINEDENVRLGLTDEGNVPGSEIAAIKAKGEAEHPTLGPAPAKWPGGKRPKR